MRQRHRDSYLALALAIDGDLPEKIGVSSNMLYKWARGERTPSDTNRHKLEAHFKCSYERLMALAEYKKVEVD